MINKLHDGDGILYGSRIDDYTNEPKEDEGDYRGYSGGSTLYTTEAYDTGFFNGREDAIFERLEHEIQELNDVERGLYNLEGTQEEYDEGYEKGQSEGVDRAISRKFGMGTDNSDCNDLGRGNGRGVDCGSSYKSGESMRESGW